VDGGTLPPLLEVSTKYVKMQIHLYAFKITIFIKAKETVVCRRTAWQSSKWNIFHFPTFPIKKFLKLVKQNWVAISYVGRQHLFFRNTQIIMITIIAPIGITHRA